MQSSISTQDLVGKTALVCGASKGIGKACALALAERVARIILVSRSEAPLVQTAKELSKVSAGAHIALACDLYRQNSPARMFHCNACES
jgi:3-oxoacyl-[acyl-carrier protein] reductase